MSKFFEATDRLGVHHFELTDDDRIVQTLGDDSKRDVTWLVRLGSNLSDSESALIDLYTDNGTGEEVSIKEVQK